METVKPMRVRIEIKEITGCGKLQPTFEISVGDVRSDQIALKGFFEFESLDFTSSSTVSLTAYNGEKVIGSIKLTLGSLFSDKNSGKPEKWLKVKTEEFQNFRIKLLASLNNSFETVLKEKPKKVSRPNTAKSEKVVECPYLARILTDHSVSTEPLDSLWRNRSAAESFIKLSLEPDSPIHAVEGFQLSLENLDELANMNGTQLKQAVRSLCEEIKQFETISKALPELQQRFKEKVAERKGVGNEGKVEIDEFKDEWEKEVERIKVLLVNRKDLKKTLVDKQEMRKNLEFERDSLKLQLADLQKKNNFDDVQQVYKNLIVSSERHKEELKRKIMDEQSAIKESLEKTKNEIKIFSKETEEVAKQVKKVSEEHQKVKEENNLLHQKINSIQSSLEPAETVLSRESASLHKFQTQIHSRDDLNTQLKSLSKTLTTDSSSLSSTYQAHLSKKANLKSDSTALSSALESSFSQTQKIQNKFLESILAKISNEQICCLRADLSALISDLSHLQAFYSTTRPLLLPDLENGSTLLSTSSESVLIQCEKLDSMIESVDQKESELDSLKSAMNEVKKRQVLHVPVKSDPVDSALAQYVNSKELPIKFTRLEGGNYLFGQSKVFIKLENSKLLAKVRGGFTPIDEFVTTYLPAELTKSHSPVRSAFSKVPAGQS